MREIKFRTFDESVPKMWSWEEIQATDDGHYVRAELFDPDPYSPVKIMLSTGLKDKEGRTMFEGDRVYVHQFYFDGFGESEYGFHATVVWSEEYCSFCFADLDDLSKFEEDDTGPFPIAQFHHHDEWLEVIGNIYEHPELLKKNQEVESEG